MMWYISLNVAIIFVYHISLVAKTINRYDYTVVGGEELYQPARGSE